MGKLIDNEPNSGYVSPVSIHIERIRKDAEAEFEKNVLHAVLECGVAVDRDELIKALQYDRDQFQKGFAAGVEWAGPKWISVKDRLPEEDGRYIVFRKGRAYGVVSDLLFCVQPSDYRIPTKQYFYFKNVMGYQVVCTDVTHWMPLPEAPKEEEE